MNRENIYFQYNPQGEILSFVNTEKRIAFYFAPDSAKLPDYEVGAPMRMILNWFCKTNNMLFVHGAAVGFNGMGNYLLDEVVRENLITSLLSLLNGFDFVGDDYIAISAHERNRVAYQLYRGCKLTNSALQKLPQLVPYVIETNKTQQKNVVMLNKAIGKLVPSLPINMMIRPTINHTALSSFQKISSMQILTELAGTTILQMPGSGADMLMSLPRFVVSFPPIPCY